MSLEWVGGSNIVKGEGRERCYSKKEEDEAAGRGGGILNGILASADDQIQAEYYMLKLYFFTFPIVFCD